MHVVLNMAASLDGRVAGPQGKPFQLSGPEDQARVHRLRASSDAVAVGVGTVLNDDPQLTARLDPRPPPQAQPVRVVFDSGLRTPRDARVLDDEAQTLILTSDRAEGAPEGATRLAAGTGERVDLEVALASLADRGIDRLMLEGGPTLAASFLAGGHVDRVHVYLAPRVLGEGPSLADSWQGLELTLTPRARVPVGEGTLVSYGVQR